MGSGVASLRKCSVMMRISVQLRENAHLGLMALAGCGNDDENKAAGTETAAGERAGGPGATAGNTGKGMSLAGTFTRDVAGKSYRIVVKEDGTFSGDGFGDHSQEKSGTYAIIDLDFGKGVIFTFSDGSQESWSIIIGEDEMRAIVSAEGDQYTKR